MVKDRLISYEEARAEGYVSADDVSRGKQDPSFFDCNFHPHDTNVDPNARGRLTAHHLRMAHELHSRFHGKTFAEIGGGRCWLTHLLQLYGEDARGYDISEWAVANSPATSGSMHVLNISREAVTPPAQIVDCHNVMGYLYDSEIDAGMQNLVASFTEHIGLDVVCEEAWLEATKVGWANNGRPYLRSRAWWDAKFTEHGLERVPTEVIPFPWQPYLYRKR